MKVFDQSIVLVTPVWNDSSRLSRFGRDLAQTLAEFDLPVGWIVADDGSSSEEKEKTRKVVEELRMSFPQIDGMYFEERTRKGGAIYRAWSACKHADWLAFVDADGAVDAVSTLKLIRCAIDSGKNGGCVGIRRNAVDAPVRRAPGRAITFYLFSALVRLMVGIPFQDTQCGAKVVPGAAFRQLHPKLMERGYIFDVELLLALHQFGSCIVESPVPWREMEGSKVSPFRDAWGMLAGLYRVRKRKKMGHYRNA
ncbi:MAG: glycosyltransferase [Verrucomicrobiota bacterium]